MVNWNKTFYIQDYSNMETKVFLYYGSPRRAPMFNKIKIMGLTAFWAMLNTFFFAFFGSFFARPQTHELKLFLLFSKSRLLTIVPYA